MEETGGKGGKSYEFSFHISLLLKFFFSYEMKYEGIHSLQFPPFPIGYLNEGQLILPFPFVSFLSSLVQTCRVSSIGLFTELRFIIKLCSETCHDSS